MEDPRRRDLSPEEVARVPEVAVLPDGARVLSAHAFGTYDGARYDGIDPGALYDCFFVCAQAFDEVVSWLEDRLAALGWPPGAEAESAPVGDVRLRWRQWTRGGEVVDLIDFTASDWTMFPPPREGWSLVRLNYSRRPARDFASDDEYEAWFHDSGDKGPRWRANT